MCDNDDARISDADLARDIIEGRKFTMEEAVARMVGGSIKGQSPVARMQQAEIEIETWLGGHLLDAGGVLKDMLHRRIKGSELLLDDFEQPLAVVSLYCQKILDSDYLLSDFVREADVEWGRVMGERPYFDQEGVAGAPDDPYTIESIRTTLTRLVAQLNPGDG